jgi:DNA ligase-4
VIGIRKLRWTLFYIRCLENKDEVCRFNVKPRLRIIDMIDQHSISRENILYLNHHGYFGQVPFTNSMPEFDVEFDLGRHLQPAELFKDTISFEELQEMAKRCSDVPEDSEREEIRWLREPGISNYLIGRSVSSSACHNSLASMTVWERRTA